MMIFIGQMVEKSDWRINKWSIRVAQSIWRINIINYIAQQMANQHPKFNPYMFPFSCPPPPPHLINSMNPYPPRNCEMPQSNDHYPPLPLPPYPFSPMFMMYPHPPNPYYPFGEQNIAPKLPENSNQMQNKHQCSYVSPQPKKMQIRGEKEPTKKPATIIILSDDEEEPMHVKQFGKKSKAIKNCQQLFKLRKLGQKEIVLEMSDTQNRKIRLIQRKKEKDGKAAKPKRKSEVNEMTDVQHVSMTAAQAHYEPHSRSTRNKYMTIKGARGRIMIGEQFQAQVPHFLPKDESFTIWIANKKNKLLLRFQK